MMTDRALQWQFLEKEWMRFYQRPKQKRTNYLDKKIFTTYINVALKLIQFRVLLLFEMFSFIAVRIYLSL